MPGPTTALKHAMLEHAGDSLLLWMGLVDEVGAELAGGDPAYARVAVEWTAPDEDDEIHPVSNPIFDIPGGSTTVAGWRCYTAATLGDDLGGKDLSPARTFEGQGTLALDKDEMGWRFV